jgi:antitoxin HicB
MDRQNRKYRVRIEKDEDGWLVAEVPALPGCYSQGRTLDEVQRNIREAITCHLESLEAHGDVIPTDLRDPLSEAIQEQLEADLLPRGVIQYLEVCV